MAKLTKKQMSAMGKQITSEAKRIRKNNPGMKWQTAMKKAGKSYKKK